MKHYYNPLSRAVTTDWMLQELQVPHEQIIVDIAGAEHYSTQFTALNPMNKVPVLTDGDRVITEAAAICAYLADKFAAKGLAPPVDSPDRARYYRYLFLAGNTLEPALSLAAVSLEHLDPASIGWGDMNRVLATIESLTPATGWALGEYFSAADVVFGGLLDLAVVFHWIEPSAAIAGYVARLRQRPAYQASHGLLLEGLAAGA